MSGKGSSLAKRGSATSGSGAGKESTAVKSVLVDGVKITASSSGSFRIGNTNRIVRNVRLDSKGVLKGNLDGQERTITSVKLLNKV